MIGNLFCAIAKAFGGCNQVHSLDDFVKWTRSHVGTIKRYEITFGELKAELENMGIKCMTAMPDYKKRYTDLATMKEIIPWLTYRADYYIAELEINCDDYALWAAADARRIFNIQGVWQAWGNTPLGYHAFNIFKTPEGYYLFESNAGFEWAGEPFRIGDHGYVPDHWK
jgi:hypothetical protein